MSGLVPFCSWSMTSSTLCCSFILRCICTANTSLKSTCTKIKMTVQSETGGCRERLCRINKRREITSALNALNWQLSISASLNWTYRENKSKTFPHILLTNASFGQFYEHFTSDFAIPDLKWPNRRFFFVMIVVHVMSSLPHITVNLPSLKNLTLEKPKINPILSKRR